MNQKAEHSASDAQWFCLLFVMVAVSFTLVVSNAMHAGRVVEAL